MTDYKPGSTEHIEQARATATAWAKDIIGREFVILDYETNGKPGEPVQVAIIDHTGKELMYTLVKPDDMEALTMRNLKGNRSAYDIHGIGPEQLQDAPSFADIYEDWYRLLDGKLVIAYNAGFEKDITRNTCRRLQLKEPQCDWHCAMLQYADWHGHWKVHDYYGGSFAWQKLEVAAEREGVIVEGAAHDALVDIRLTLGLIHKMAGAQMPKQLKHSLTIHTAQMSVTDPDMLDITIKSARTETEKLFAPTWEMVMKSKKGLINWAQYTTAYYDLLRSRYAEDKKLFLDLLKRERVVLKCYCGSPEKCHRSLAMDIISKIAVHCGVSVTYAGELPRARVSQPEQSALFDKVGGDHTYDL